jgi:hypothetical protein
MAEEHGKRKTLLARQCPKNSRLARFADSGESAWDEGENTVI